MNNKIASYVGFCVKKGDAVMGLDFVEKSKRKFFLIICDSDFSQNSFKRAESTAQKKGCKVVTVEGLSDLLKRNCKLLGICDENLANAILNLL